MNLKTFYFEKKKILRLVPLIAIFIVLSLGLTAHAAEDGGSPSYSITVKNATAGETYSAYKIFDVTYMTATDDEGNATANPGYSYTIPASSAWLKIVASYTLKTNETYKSGKESYSGKGLTLVRSADKKCFVVSINTAHDSEEDTASFFSAADFAEYLAAEAAKEGSALTADGTAKVIVNKDGDYTDNSNVISLSSAGYYLITCDGKGHALAELSTAAPTVTIYDKNEPESETAPPETEKNTPDSGSLPQTGQLKWPIPLLFVLGLIAVILGIIRKPKFLRILGSILILAGLALLIYNMSENTRAKNASSIVLELLKDEESSEKNKSGSNNNSIEIKVDDTYYIGMIRIEELGIELPIAKDFSYASLLISPCAYSGSAEGHDFVICAHNYSSHFGYLSKLSKGSRITFTSASGKEFNYSVENLSFVLPSDVADVTDSPYDLVLFTCNYDGSKRIAVGCILD